MAFPDIVGIAGSFSVPSKTRALVEDIVGRAVTRFGYRSKVIDLSQFGADLGGARNLSDLSGTSRDIVDYILNARALVIAVPVYKGSYPGLFKHLFDLIEPAALVGKPVLLAATGGGDKHALIIEHQLRPLFGFFETQTLATGLYASERDFIEGRPASPALIERTERAVSQFEPYLSAGPRTGGAVISLARHAGTVGDATRQPQQISPAI